MFAECWTRLCRTVVLENQLSPRPLRTNSSAFKNKWGNPGRCSDHEDQLGDLRAGYLERMQKHAKGFDAKLGSKTIEMPDLVVNLSLISLTCRRIKNKCRACKKN